LTTAQDDGKVVSLTKLNEKARIKLLLINTTKAVRYKQKKKLMIFMKIKTQSNN
jgi:hypothetical protein